MSAALTYLYDRLPVRSRSCAASVWGGYLRWWRYGSQTERLVEEALEREHWTEERWKDWQAEQVQYILWRAMRHVPYYREIWMARRRLGDRRSWRHLENWPVLEKESVRANPRAFVADDCVPAMMFRERTTGTTGTPLQIWRSRASLLRRYALYEARHRRWYGVSRFDRWAIIGGKLVVPPRQRHPPFWVWNAALRQLYLSSCHIAPGTARDYAEGLTRHDIRLLWGYTSSLHNLAGEIVRQRLKVAGVRVVVTNAESLSEIQRRTIAEAFQCPVRETYGMVEFVAAAGECEQGTLHYWPEVGKLEVIGNGSGVAAGDLVCTGLQNPDMPLIRYRVGDRSSPLIWDHRCACGRRLPAWRGVSGRNSGMLLTTDGRYVSSVNPVLHGQSVREAQIIQETATRVRVLYVPDTDFTADSARSIARRLRNRLGDVQVELEPVGEIPRGPGGKFQPLINRLTQPERAAATQPLA